MVSGKQSRITDSFGLSKQPPAGFIIPWEGGKPGTVVVNNEGEEDNGMADGKKLEVKAHVSIDDELYKRLTAEQRLEAWTTLRTRAKIPWDLLPIPFYDNKTLVHYMLFMGFKEDE